MELNLETLEELINEAIDNKFREFVFTAQEVKQLEASIRKITSEASKALNAQGPVLMSVADLLEPAEAEPMRKVAEGEVIDIRDRFKGWRGPGKSQFSPEEEEERLALRQKYYGPEGEVPSVRPGASRKGLEKGIGRMTPPEFEEASYVLKVPQEVLDDFALMVEETRRAGELFTQARDWYHTIRKLLDQETKSDRDAALLGLMIATYSPRAKFSLNLAEAAYMFKAVERDAKENPEMLKEYLETFVGAEKREPAEERGFTKANKVPNFVLNLIAPELAGKRDPDTGAMTHNDIYAWNSTIDTWMIDAFYPMLKRASTQKEFEGLKGKMMSDPVSYRYMSGLVGQEAKRLGLLPHELQAIVWVAMKRRQSGEDAATTEESIGQIKEAITNIKQINMDLGDIRDEFEENSWLGLLFDEIDSKGFEEASKFILGIKSEKGKVVTPGVRSISARGKKGGMFKYFPELPPEPKAPKAKKPKAPKAKPEKRYEDPKYSELKTWYVMNDVIQMPTGKFNNLYDSVMLYLDPEFSTEKAIEYIEGRFDPEATKTSAYFTEQLINKVMRRLGAIL
jgi:hypothetical protein